ncbi:formylglycine-generating enzyme family protein [Stieleria sp. JC731]|uniref:formylglycine-generating enzyme family protein n=1 Tax=Stieleria sp. JC731 TaxID=2894195 RepID=UPI001E43E5AF|nr:formylglycine-generating enzyme family protein [Stieleria sp. JC731]MCC9603773.1 formylglycine-generating enzyme family protein [Stieleria sp. JC731]
MSFIVSLLAPQSYAEGGKTNDSLNGNRPGEQRTFTEQQIKMRWCPPGRFKMGRPESDKRSILFDNEKPQVDVKLTRGFWLAETELTQGAWEHVMGTKPWGEHDHKASEKYTWYRSGANYPATYIDWADAVLFCKTLTAQEQAAGRLPKGWAYRLPTEAEWEYACRAGTETKFNFGDDTSELAKHAWFKDNASGVSELYAHAVGAKRPNNWGFFDMHGNVWEWCSDLHDDDYYKVSPGIDPMGATKGSSRVNRGGGWILNAKYCRCATRSGINPAWRSSNLGFRLALSPSRL